MIDPLAVPFPRDVMSNWERSGNDLYWSGPRPEGLYIALRLVAYRRYLVEFGGPQARRQMVYARGGRPRQWALRTARSKALGVLWHNDWLAEVGAPWPEGTRFVVDGTFPAEAAP